MAPRLRDVGVRNCAKIREKNARTCGCVSLSTKVRKLTILKKYSEFVIIKDGLKAGERIVTSKLSTASNGIKVNLVYK